MVSTLHQGIVLDKYCQQEISNPSTNVSCKGECKGEIIRMTTTNVHFVLKGLKWVYGSWSPCSVSCDGGVQEREAWCEAPGGKTIDVMYHEKYYL